MIGKIIFTCKSQCRDVTNGKLLYQYFYQQLPVHLGVFFVLFLFYLFVFVTSAKAETTEGRKVTKTTLLLQNYYLVLIFKV